MKFEIPFKFSEKYLEFVNSNIEKIYSVYFPVFSLFPLTARIAFYEQNVDLLKKIDSRIKRKLLLNGKFIPENYYSSSFLKKLRRFMKKNDIYCCVVADGYCAKFLNDNKIPVQLSVNFGISLLKEFKHYEIYFRGLVKDVCFDRKMNLTMEINDEIQKALEEGITPILVANEGCLYNCLFKDSHDFIISLFNRQFVDHRVLVSFDFKKLSQNHCNYSCINVYSKRPWLMMTSPFIRPEDLKSYPEGVVFKIAKRESNEDELIEIIKSYFNGEYTGNLITLMDTTSFLNERYWVFNEIITKKFPDFHLVRRKCNKYCLKCPYCREVFRRASQKLKGGHKR